VVETFEVSLPAEVEGPVRLEVTLRYREFPQKMMKLALGRAHQRVARVEHWARRITGAVFILAGIYLTLAYVYRVG
jgi:hypothetical protein